MKPLWRILRALPLVVVSPLLFLLPVGTLALIDLLWLLLGPRRSLAGARPRSDCASIVIPNWNGRELLEKYLPAVVEAVADHPGSEIIVVDNGSADASAEFVRQNYPGVKVVALQENLGFAGGSNIGVKEARNDIVVLLNNDMRVAKTFLAPLLAGFEDDRVFSVSCQIYFRDPNKTREETGLTQGWWEHGQLRVRHRIDERIAGLFPCFYGGGGSCAFDRAKFLELGGFDELLRPFYLEDTDLGYQAWKRGWKVLYQPTSVVWHEHRGTIGRRFTEAYIQSILHKNFLLFVWKNVHEWRRLIEHFVFAAVGSYISVAFGDSLERANLAGFLRANLQLHQLARSRWRSRSLAEVSDTEAFRRPMGGYFRDRFSLLPPQPERPAVLFVSPYPICPPVHGGAVFMSQTLHELTKHSAVHLVVLLDSPHEEAAHSGLARRCESAEFLVRIEGQSADFASVLPHAIREFRNQDLEWVIHRQILLRAIDLVQFDYLPMGQYRGEYRQLVCILFEHDIYFQSIARQLPGMQGLFKKVRAGYEFLRGLHYELHALPRFDRVQVCSESNRRYLRGFLPKMMSKVDDDLRAGINVSRYSYRESGREPLTMLFIGSFRHAPNLEALQWFARRVMPHVLKGQPEARSILIGSDPPPRHSLPDYGNALEMRGFVEDIREPLARYAVFVCPIRSGSGIRVKLLEAFASGIPVVSTALGAEGLAAEDGNYCRLADDPDAFAAAVLHLFRHPLEAAEMARRARAHVECRWDMPIITARLAESYRAAIAGKRGDPRGDRTATA